MATPTVLADDFIVRLLEAWVRVDLYPEVALVGQSSEELLRIRRTHPSIPVNIVGVLALKRARRCDQVMQPVRRSDRGSRQLLPRNVGHEEFRTSGDRACQ